jgi:hypothetical protein
MKATHERFAMYVNKKYDEHGHVFGERFWNGLVESDRHLLGCFRYIARNPVEAGMCKAAGDWPWSAHAALAGACAPPTFLDVERALQFFATDPTEARREYLRLTAKDERELLATFNVSGSWDWLKSAVDDFGVPVTGIAQYLGVTDRAVYKRLARVRADADGFTQGSVP